MKNIEKLKIEHQELKERLLRLTDFINSEEYYKVSISERNLLNQQRAGMEVYLNALTRRLCNDDEAAGFGGSSAMLPLIMSMFNTPPFQPLNMSGSENTGKSEPVIENTSEPSSTNLK